MVTCGNMETADIVTVGWTGIVSSDPPRAYISLRPSRWSYRIIRETGEFAIHPVSSSMVRALDFCGNVTGRKVNKFERCHLSRVAANQINCPLIGEAPLALEGRVFQRLPMGSHDMFLADIVAVDVDEALVDEDGRLALNRAHLVTYAHGAYFELGRRLGKIGFSVRKKRK